MELLDELTLCAIISDDKIKWVPTMEKKDIALVQLRAAAKMYNAADYVSCLTLSGAAEEILGKIAFRRTKSNEMENGVEFTKSIYTAFGKPVPLVKIIRDRINSVKNEVKHNDTGENSWVLADFEFEASMKFVAAVKNHFRAYDKMPADRIIMKLFDNLTL